MKELIKLLTESYGPSSREENVRNIIQKEIERNVDEVKVDYLGNLIATKKGKSKSPKNIMLAAHMDEIGFIITHIDEKGFLRFTNVGGIHTFRLTGARIILPSGRQGVIFNEPVEKITDLNFDKMFIDIGVSTREEAEKFVKVGDIATTDQQTVFNGDRIMGKALDDRIGCAILIDVLKKIQDHPDNLHFVFTSQEEVGLRGARTAAYGIDPDFGLALDVTMTGDTPEARKMEVSLGEGVAIKVRDSSLLTNTKVIDFLVETASKNKIKYQMEVLEAGGTDAGAINLTRGGVLAGCLSIPCRYIHSPSELIDMNDVQACCDLLQKVLEKEIPF